MIDLGVLCEEDNKVLARGSIATFDRCIQLSIDDPQYEP
jgi:hypothetical protein